MPWELNVNLKDVILDFTYLSLFLMVGTILRRYVTVFQKFLIPNNILGGFFGLIVGSQVLKIIPLDGERLGIYVYHFLALTFIIMGLRKEKTSWGKGPLSKTNISILCYLGQGISGLLIAILLIKTLMPDLFPGIGLLVPLGFGMGPGLAYAMGSSWEVYHGVEVFPGGGMVGLTFASIGYLVAFFGGLGFISWGIKNHKTKLINGLDEISDDLRKGILKDSELPIAGKLTMATEAIEPMAFQVGLIGTVYLATYIVVNYLAGVLHAHHLDGFVATLWSFHFIFAILLSLAVRKVLDVTKRSYMIDTGLMNRSAGILIDYLVTASIAAISIAVVKMYWLPILIMSIVGGFITWGIIWWASYRSYDDYPFERFVGVFGEMTGTINSGLVLIRVTDPQFQTAVAEDSIYGAGLTIFVGFPLLIILNLPMNLWANSLPGYWYTIGLFFIYAIIIIGFWRLIGYLNFKRVLD